MSQRLTIVLPLKGRPLFTLRFLYHANRVKLPYRILIADGEVITALADILAGAKSHFPNLDVTYVQYPDDRDYSHFFRKMADVMGHVSTPYSMLSDNDDFLCVTGIEAMLDFLDRNNDHVCATGRVAGFGISPVWDSTGLTGKPNRYFTWFSPMDASQPQLRDRIRESGSVNWTYYAVVRTSALATIQKEAAKIDFSDLAIHETFHTMRMFSFGRARFDARYVTYFRQFGTSASGIYHFDWGRHLIYGRLSQDIALAVEYVSNSVSEGEERAVLAEDMRTVILKKYIPSIMAYFGARQAFKRWLQMRVPGFLLWIRRRPRLLPARERAALLAALKSSNASVDAMRNIERELAEVEDTLSGTGFPNFLAPYLPRFLAAATGQAAPRVSVSARLSDAR